MFPYISTQKGGFITQWFVVAAVIFLAASSAIWAAMLSVRDSKQDNHVAVNVVDGGERRVRPIEYVDQTPWRLPIVSSKPLNSSMFDPDGDPEQIRRFVADQPMSSTWSPQAESAVRAAFASGGWTRDIAVDCRSTGCEVTGELTGLTPSNVKQMVSELSSPLLNENLRRRGFQGGNNPVFTVITEKPVRISFSRVVSKLVDANDQR